MVEAPLRLPPLDPTLDQFADGRALLGGADLQLQVKVSADVGRQANVAFRYVAGEACCSG